ncbi:GNAT family N-acetyltransferase [Colwellia sp. MEBiC06753]
MSLIVKAVDYQNQQQMNELLELLDGYAKDPMGGGEPLNEEVRNKLASEMAARGFVFSFIAYLDDVPVGLANCIESFSTFAAKPVINIHDMAVVNGYRGKGISQALLAAVENHAKKVGAAKITLEVLTGNTVAMNAYKKFGFNGYELDPAMGKAEFWEKKCR